MGLILRQLAATVTAVTAMLLGAAPAGAGFDEPFPQTLVTMSGPEGPIPKGHTATYTATVANEGSGPTESTALELSSYRVQGERPVPNPYVDFTTSQGQCARAIHPSKFGDYHTLSCELGSIAPGASATVTATVEVNESMDHHAFVGGAGNTAEVTTLVDAPPVVSGSSKIKLRGLPGGCADDDFNLKAKAKRAKKIVASLRGPLTADGKPPAGEVARNRKLGAAKGQKLKASVEAGSLDPGYYEIKLAAKYDRKPKQKASVLLQRCPDPGGR